ncbi:hypothetical protein [Prescottella agglutinans]|uniref:hypothetical protein n=1 Tax=Prescottella agglutinans TaxID=1644129 RepID=UPI0024760C23|nr:hypothetical protein [Prescottella agglutinans]
MASVTASAGTNGCDAVAKQPDELYGKEWLRAYKQDPSPGVALRRCRYSSTVEGIELVPPSSVVTVDGDVRTTILSLPDSTDPGHRCGPGGDYLFVFTFDEYTVLDQSGTPAATFQTSDNHPCGINNAIPSV